MRMKETNYIENQTKHKSILIEGKQKSMKLYRICN